MKPPNTLSVMLAGLAGVVFPAAAMAQGAPSEPCELEISGDTAIEWQGLYGRGYEVTANQQEFETLPVTIRHQGAACEFFIVAAPVSSGADPVLTGASDRLAWDLLQSTNGPSLISSDFFGSLNNQIAGGFTEGVGAQNLVLYFTVLPGQFVRGGLYDGDFVIRLFRREHGGPELAAELQVTALAPVASILRIQSDAFPGTSRQTDVDLGDLNTPSSRSIDFDIVSNAAILAEFDSANGGVLAHEFGAPGVPYQLRLNGSELGLAGIASRRLDMVSPTGQRNAQVEIIVPPPRGTLAAGHYSDTLTVTFTADP